MKTFNAAIGVLTGLVSVSCSSSPLATGDRGPMGGAAPASSLASIAPEAGDVAPNPDAGSSSSLPSIAPEAGDMAPGPASNAVWTADSVAFSITNTGDGNPGYPAFSECSDPQVMTWTFDTRSGQLAKTGCENGKRIDRIGFLSADQQSFVVASVVALRTATPEVIFDAPEVRLAVTDSRGVDSTYFGAQWFTAPPPPAVDSTAIFSLENALDSFVDRPLLLGEWCADRFPCAPGLSCYSGTDAGGIAILYCHAN